MNQENVLFLVVGALTGWLMGVVLKRIITNFLQENIIHETGSSSEFLLNHNFSRSLNALLLWILPIIIALLSFWRGWSPELLNDLTLMGSIIGLSVIDWKTQLIDSRFILIALVLRTLWIIYFKPELFLNSLAGLLVGAGLLYLIGFFYEAIRKRQGLGDGDPAILGLVGFWVGWAGLGLVLLIATVSGLLIGGFILWNSKKPIFHSPIPFSPFICLGGLMVHLYQQSIRIPRPFELWTF